MRFYWLLSYIRLAIIIYGQGSGFQTSSFVVWIDVNCCLCCIKSIDLYKKLSIELAFRIYMHYYQKYYIDRLLQRWGWSKQCFYCYYCCYVVGFRCICIAFGIIITWRKICVNNLFVIEFKPISWLHGS